MQALPAHLGAAAVASGACGVAMTTTYTPLTFGELIDHLDALGEQPVRGLTGRVHSHCAWYDRPATEPADVVHPGTWLADAYRSELDTPLTGYGGGGQYRDFADKLVHYADFGQDGPVILGFERTPDGVHELVLLKDNSHG